MRFVSSCRSTKIRIPFILFLCSIFFIPLNVEAARYRLDREWKSLSLGNIYVHYPSGYENFADYVAMRAVTHLDSLDYWFGIFPPEVHINLNPDLDNNSAFATILPLRVELPVTPAIEKGIRPQNGLYLDRVLMHELTHSVQHSTVSGITSVLRPVIGETIAPLGLQPDWITEGLAVCTESMAGGGRLNSSFHLMYWRTAILSGNPWNLNKLSKPGNINPPANRAYVGGSFLVNRLLNESFGKDNVSDWLYRQASLPGLPGIAFKKSFEGRTASFIYRQIITQTDWDLRVKILMRQRSGFAFGKTLLEDKRTSWRHPLWMNNGELVASKSSYDFPPAFSRLNPGGIRSLSKDESRSYSVNYKSTSYKEGLITSELRSGKWATEEQKSYIVYVDSNGKSKLIGKPPLRGWSPAWSEKNHQLAWVTPSKYGGTEIRVINLDENTKPIGRSRIIARTNYGIFADPEWNATGRILAFSADLGDGEKVVLWDVKSNLFFEISINGAKCTWDPSFSNDGSLWVSADPEEIFDLFEIDFINKQAWRRTRVISGAIEPAVSNDGKSVAYSHYTNEGFILALLDSSIWSEESADVSLTRVDPERYRETSKEIQGLGVTEPYNCWKYTKPRFWLPAYGNTNEDAVGIATYGRDPLGLIEWQLQAMVGIETRKPDISLSTTYRALPLDMTLFMTTYPDDLAKIVPVDTVDTPDPNIKQILFRYDTRNPRRWEGGLFFSQNFRYDNWFWSKRFIPRYGIVRRDRFIQTRRDQGLMLRHFNGFSTGFDYVQWRGASRDPVSRNLLRVNLSAEHDLTGFSNLNGNMIQLAIRYHIPSPVNTVVIGMTGAAQSQTGSALSRNNKLDYSRVIARPRGYDSDSLLPPSLTKGKIAKLGLELQYPLMFIDKGLGLGILFFERFKGVMFFEAASGWGDNRTLQSWTENDNCFSAGSEISSVGYVYDAYLDFTVGAAWRSTTEDWSVYFRLGIPFLRNIYGATLPTGRM
ncbi:MAG: hypothetical protein P9L92_04855 [Candidatus Electryonea clarkiae]|nr:hypothetical protein [Candidatus Electryonea clarkiae]MDP8288113.1 hypothetical protein [Candidatus Electryonea clarkiae]